MMKSTGSGSSYSSPNRHAHSRTGLTLLELMVVMGIISLLLMLLLPATLQVRASSRRMTCLNHLRQVGLAMMMNFDQSGRFPASGHFAADGKGKYHSWVTTLLPYLDQANLFQSYELSKPCTNEKNFELSQTPLPVLTCPDDVSLVKGKGNLSFVVNGGIGWTIPTDCPASLHVEDQAAVIAPLDLNGNGVTCPLESEPGPGSSDLEILKDLSLFFVENWPAKTGTERFHKPADITDGTTTTLMLAENVRAGIDPEAQTSWGSPEPLRNMFFVSSAICADRRCEDDSIDISKANNRQGLPKSQESLNAALTQAEGTAPWPSSGHPGLVNVVWCDGHVSSLSEQIDGRIYFAVTTPRGTQRTKKFAEPILSANSF